MKSKKTASILCRIDKIEIFILENIKYLSRSKAGELTSFVMEKFDVSERTAQKDIKEAKAKIVALGKRDIKKAFKTSMIDYEYLWLRSRGEDLRLALDVRKSKDKLLGLHEDRIILSGEINNKITFVENLD